MPKVVTEILNYETIGERWTNEHELADWDGLGSDAIAETLRALLRPFDSKKIAVRIMRDERNPIFSVDHPTPQYLIWDAKASVDGKPTVIGYIMVHSSFPSSHTRCTLRYTPTGAKLRQAALRTTASR